MHAQSGTQLFFFSLHDCQRGAAFGYIKKMAANQQADSDEEDSEFGILDNPKRYLLPRLVNFGYKKYVLFTLAIELVGTDSSLLLGMIILKCCINLSPLACITESTMAVT